MKTRLLIVSALVLWAFTSCEEKIDTAKEEAAIKAVIEGEIKASFDGNYDDWASYFVQEPYLLWMQAWKEGYGGWRGWQDIGTQAKTWVKPERKGSILFDGNIDYIIRIFEDVAWVSFKCNSTSVSDGQGKKNEAMEVRFLEKHDGNWKIVYLGSIYTSSY